MMSSNDSGQGESICTPRRVQKRLFSQGGSSSKRNLFQTDHSVRNDGGISGEDSDLGPMSPLANTDNSCDSSSGKEYDSPYTTPDNSPRVLSLTWDRLRPSSSQKKSGLGLFSSLRKLTREARDSPRRRIFPSSPRSLLGTPNRRNQENCLPGTPEKQTELDSSLVDGIVPETPQKDFIAETPQKESYSENRLITPLGSVCKEIVLPPMHRRKSVCNCDSSEGSSPERQDNSKKRHANDSLHLSGTKLMKTDEGCSIPKARASLFPEEKNESPKLLPLSTKSFYSSNNTNETKRHSLSFGWRSAETESRKRHSLLLQSHHRRSAGSAKRPKFGEINAGVKHGIKRPKVKHHLSHAETQKKKGQSPNTFTKEIIDEPMMDSKENEHTEANVSAPETFSVSVRTRVPSPVEDPTKRFFKTNRTIKPNHVATVTVNDKIKLKVSDGKIALNQKKTHFKHQNKKPKLDVIVFDATDLTVDEPTFDTSMNQKDVAGILKVLEDDWADDEFDTMEPLTVAQASNRSPLQSMSAFHNVLMSPASVLSTMTSSMNIKDQHCPKNTEDNSIEPGTSEPRQCSNETEKKLFPLFAKGYTSNSFETNSTEKRTRGVKRPASWQLSIKLNGGSDQYQLDAGQKRFGTTHCHDCGVVYQIGEPKDENDHLIFHNSIKTLKFNGWKNERVVYQNPLNASRIITIEPSDPKHWWKKVEEVLAIVDRDLGLADMTLSDYHGKKVYLYIREKIILGVLLVEPVKTAHRMIPELIELNCCSEEVTPAKCGVNVIWTALSHRRQGIARKLLDVMRSSYYFAYIITLDDIAFSIPTPSGKIFAEKYVGTRNFKVYS